jgi:hypothetical protein
VRHLGTAPAKPSPDKLGAPRAGRKSWRDGSWRREPSRLPELLDSIEDRQQIDVGEGEPIGCFSAISDVFKARPASKSYAFWIKTIRRFIISGSERFCSHLRTKSISRSGI